ncbi:Di-copper centre-containing protein [Conidiobolus coronatus NRRL 28638]|uniref:Di-copper centre-containing protein n=1 Tax=Conidiobolus coronatus (strain ATCC 28846 / CBS 209.66 / NRRL 28638) TaxID=796925 RepID=A0A137P4Q5_CONC2|nr:Di-copper centre-containing protein [Conidiobolus coronatus NRRL 28638]|eukprot:KXN69929.1 Di-copper centre-containing protein [Conidiobolus coronatus NRRL 28638]
MFLAWHSWFLYELEQAIMQIDPEVRFPYWDWSVNYPNINNDPIWQKYEKCFTRKNQFDDAISESKPEIEELSNSKSYLDFTENLELGSHGCVHVGISIEFAGSGSLSDPLFYAHHTFIDKIWFDRQNRHSEFTLSYLTSLSTQMPGFPAK